MASVGLHDLIAALASAVAEAEQIVRVHQIRNLRSFFTDNNEPVKVDIALPKPGQQADAEPNRLQVPLITLIHPGGMSITEMDIKFSAELGGVSGAAAALKAATDHGMLTAQGKADTSNPEDVGWSATPARLSVDVSHDTLKSSDTGAASVRLKVRQVEVPEGLARVLSKLASSL